MIGGRGEPRHRSSKGGRHVTENPKIVARSLADAERELPKLNGEYAVVSIGSPETNVPEGFDPDDPHHLRLQFDDVTSETPLLGRKQVRPPSREHIDKLLGHADTLLEASLVYCHCAAGISRSTAAAFILRCYSGGPGTERAAIEAVLEDNPFASPNRLMVEFADNLMDRGGEMLAALEAAKTNR